MTGSPAAEPLRNLPSARDRRDEIAARIGDRTPALFLDFDGTLTPIVDDPDAALLPARTRTLLRRAADRMPVAVVSGRDLPDVRERVRVPGAWYAGSHGFDLAGPAGEREQRGTEALPDLDAAERELRRALGEREEVPGVSVERKRFAVAVHHRGAPRDRLPAVRRRVREIADRGGSDLRATRGKEVLELRPDVDWDKGSALRWLWSALELDADTHHPLYVGDDVTDEDAFRALEDLPGTGIVVGGGNGRRESRADYSLADPGEVAAFLEDLLRRVS